MIFATRLNKKPFYLNCDLIELIEETPDTLITMTTGKRFLVEESAQQIIEKIISYRNLCFQDVTLRFVDEEKHIRENIQNGNIDKILSKEEAVD